MIYNPKSHLYFLHNSKTIYLGRKKCVVHGERESSDWVAYDAISSKWCIRFLVWVVQKIVLTVIGIEEIIFIRLNKPIQEMKMNEVVVNESIAFITFFIFHDRYQIKFNKYKILLSKKGLACPSTFIRSFYKRCFLAHGAWKNKSCLSLLSGTVGRILTSFCLLLLTKRGTLKSIVYIVFENF